jgi:hypothetical protein
MKMLINEVQLPLPGSRERATTLPAIKADREPQTIAQSKLSDKELALARWVHCLGRGRHDFDEEGLCVDCDTARRVL